MRRSFLAIFSAKRELYHTDPLAHDRALFNSKIYDLTQIRFAQLPSQLNTWKTPKKLTGTSLWL